MRIGLLRHGIGQIGHATGRMKRRPPPREARDGEVEAAPEEMDRAAFADEGGAELEHPADLAAGCARSAAAKSGS